MTYFAPREYNDVSTRCALIRLCTQHGTTPEQIIQHRRRRGGRKVRHINDVGPRHAIWRALVAAGHSIYSIGRVCKRDPSSIRHGVNKK